MKQGINPAVVKRQRNVAAVELAFQKYAAVFVDRYAKVEQSRSWRQAERTLKNNVTPKLKDRPLPDITRREIKTLLEDIAATRPATARYAHATLRKLFRWAVDRGDIEQSPMIGMPPPATVTSRDRVLIDDELTALWTATDSLHRLFRGMYRLLIVTGQRRDEVAELKWAELDRAAALWTLPADRAKNGARHLVPLSSLAVAILDELAGGDKWPAKGFVFSTTGKTAVSGFSKAKVAADAAMLASLRKTAAEADAEPPEALNAWRLHDIRRTLATGFQRLGIRFEVTEAVLNHVSGSKSGVAGIYQRHDWQDEKRTALDAWARHLEALFQPAAPRRSNIVALPTGRALLTGSAPV